jgi:hypothetical protein
MKESVYVKEGPHNGRGVYAARDIRKDEVILEFNGPSVKIESLDGIPREVSITCLTSAGRVFVVRETLVCIRTIHAIPMRHRAMFANPHAGH